MSDNGDKLNTEKAVTQEEPQPIQMIITFYPANGRVDVSGPLTNRTLCYGMLEMAKDAIYELKEKMKPQIQVPKGGIMNFVRSKL